MISRDIRGMSDRSPNIRGAHCARLNGMAHTITVGSHVAHLDPLNGVGLLCCPTEESDVLDPFLDFGPTAHEIDLDRMARALADRGWEVLEGDDILEAGITYCIDAQGRRWLSLHGPSVRSQVELPEVEGAFEALAREFAGV